MVLIFLFRWPPRPPAPAVPVIGPMKVCDLMPCAAATPPPPARRPAPGEVAAERPPGTVPGDSTPLTPPAGDKPPEADEATPTGSTGDAAPPVPRAHGGRHGILRQRRGPGRNLIHREEGKRRIPSRALSCRLTRHAGFLATPHHAGAHHRRPGSTHHAGRSRGDGCGSPGNRSPTGRSRRGAATGNHGNRGRGGLRVTRGGAHRAHAFGRHVPNIRSTGEGFLEGGSSPFPDLPRRVNDPPQRGLPLRAQPRGIVFTSLARHGPHSRGNEGTQRKRKGRIGQGTHHGNTGQQHGRIGRRKGLEEGRLRGLALLRIGHCVKGVLHGKHQLSALLLSGSKTHGAAHHQSGIAGERLTRIRDVHNLLNGGIHNLAVIVHPEIRRDRHQTGGDRTNARRHFPPEPGGLVRLRKLSSAEGRRQLGDRGGGAHDGRGEGKRLVARRRPGRKRHHAYLTHGPLVRPVQAAGKGIVLLRQRLHAGPQRIAQPFHLLGVGFQDAARRTQATHENNPVIVAQLVQARDGGEAAVDGGPERKPRNFFYVMRETSKAGNIIFLNPQAGPI